MSSGKPRSGYRLTQQRIEQGCLTPDLLEAFHRIEKAKRLAVKLNIKPNSLVLTPEKERLINLAVSASPRVQPSMENPEESTPSTDADQEVAEVA